MGMALETWISELEMDDYIIDEIPNYYSREYDEYVQLVNTPEDNFQQASSSEVPMSAQDMCERNASTMTTTTTPCGGSSVQICRTSFERPNRKLKADITPTSIITTDQDNTGSLLEQMDEVLADEATNKDFLDGCNKNNEQKVGQKRTNAMTKTPAEPQDRVMAERKRREKLSQRFIALSAMIPGLKKMDKASVLGDAINYLKQLQENMKTLEEKSNKISEEYAVFVKKSQKCLSDDTSSSRENFNGKCTTASPEIEARISENYVFIRIHCEKQKGLAVKVFTEIEKLHLDVVNTTFMPFGNYAMDINVVAQMEDEFSMTVNDVARNLCSAFMKFM